MGKGWDETGEKGVFLVTLDEETKGEVRLGGIASFLSTKLETITGIETRYCVLGHIQRGGSPIPFDRVLGVRCGAKAIDLIEEGKFGETVALHRVDMVSMPIEDAVRTLHIVDSQSQLVEAAREIGISFGDASS